MSGYKNEIRTWLKIVESSTRMVTGPELFFFTLANDAGVEGRRGEAWSMMIARDAA